MAFLDPPYNVKIKNIVGRGRAKHGEFAMASGEMSRKDFVDFLRETLGNAATVSHQGAVHFVCMDWRHIGELIEAGQAVVRRHAEPGRLGKDECRARQLLPKPA